MTLAVFHDFPGLENGLTKFHDFPGRVVTLLDLGSFSAILFLCCLLCHVEFTLFGETLSQEIGKEHLQNDSFCAG